MDHAGYLILRNVTRLVIRRQQLSTVTMSRKVEEELERLLRVLFSFFSLEQPLEVLQDLLSGQLLIVPPISDNTDLGRAKKAFGLKPALHVGNIIPRSTQLKISAVAEPYQQCPPPIFVLTPPYRAQIPALQIN